MRYSRESRSSASFFFVFSFPWACSAGLTHSTEEGNLLIEESLLLHLRNTKHDQIFKWFTGFPAGRERIDSWVSHNCVCSRIYNQISFALFRWYHNIFHEKPLWCLTLADLSPPPTTTPSTPPVYCHWRGAVWWYWQHNSGSRTNSVLLFSGDSCVRSLIQTERMNMRVLKFNMIHLLLSRNLWQNDVSGKVMIKRKKISVIHLQ